MKKSKISAIALVALAGVVYVSSTLNKETDHATPAVNRPPDACDPNYSGCVPIASDVDCAGGGGNGPEYVKGPVRVIGTDIYHLDRDGDGIACE
jgi:resuscitation-promoting factor RpfB